MILNLFAELFRFISKEVKNRILRFVKVYWSRNTSVVKCIIMTIEGFMA